MPKTKHLGICLLLVLGYFHALCASTPWDRAIDAMEVRNYSLADSLFQEILDEFPNRTDAHLYRAQTSYWLGNYETTLRHLDLSDPPIAEKGKAEMLRAYCLSALGQNEQALQIMKDVVLDYVELSDSARAFLVNYYVEIENYEEARKLITTRIEDNARPSLFAMRAEVALHLKDPEQAINDFSSAISLDPHKGVFLLRRAIIYGERGQHNKAIQDYDKAILLDPNNDTLWRLRLAESLVSGKYDLALTDLEKLTDRYPEEIELREWKFECYLNLEQYENASKELKTIEQYEVDNWLLKRYDGNELMARSRMGRAGHFFREITMRMRREWVFWVPAVLLISSVTFFLKRRSRRTSS